MPQSLFLVLARALVVMSLEPAKLSNLIRNERTVEAVKRRNQANRHMWRNLIKPMLLFLFR